MAAQETTKIGQISYLNAETRKLKQSIVSLLSLNRFVKGIYLEQLIEFDWQRRHFGTKLCKTLSRSLGLCVECRRVSKEWTTLLS